MKRIERLSGTNEEISRILYEEQLKLSQQNLDVEDAVSDILEAVRKDGDQALTYYSQLFDKVEVTDFEVGQDLIERAFEEIDPQVLTALKNAQTNIESYHQQQLEAGFEDSPSPGVLRGQLIRPIERVGTYVPGGTAAYPSSVLMNVIPAKIAGVKEIIMITPPQERFNPAILVAAKLAGVSRIFQVGGAQGVAALAYGTETIPKVDKITGPGNIFVATAKKLVYGLVGIDMIAGPSEIGVIADASASPVYVAADLLSQAEHDKLARAILVTDSEELADQVEQELDRQLKTLPREEIARASIENNGRIIIAPSKEAMFELMNQVAPEHLEVAMDDAYSYLDKIENAGSVFLGHYTSEPIGDYYAGANHVLPTTSTSRFSSALGVHDFIKRIQYTQYSREAVRAADRDITSLAYAEGLQAHAKAIEARRQDK
ncbi:histidinol dehydrogenase [Streptococcus panodentis]|uniref:Histidinol dehydrogenase n=1 Tax=Streptococcus panodentis TaxID=1581472 RepID=A0ABS5AUX0_9STRE|nr:histidinol dehydrogenase [Streptococcus panodentis]MBP2620365.1 histidinol dehydrogenase [Streptococcus panodentis]